MLKEHTIKTPKTTFPSSLLSLSSQPRRVEISVGILSIKYLKVPLIHNKRRFTHVWVSGHVMNISTKDLCPFCSVFSVLDVLAVLMFLHLLQGNGSEKLNRMDVMGVKLCSPQLLTVTFLSSIPHHLVSLVNKTNAPDHYFLMSIIF